MLLNVIESYIVHREAHSQRPVDSNLSKCNSPVDCCQKRFRRMLLSVIESYIVHREAHFQRPVDSNPSKCNSPVDSYQKRFRRMLLKDRVLYRPPIITTGTAGGYDYLLCRSRKSPSCSMAWVMT